LKYPSLVLSATDEENSLPQSYNLTQNFPNPFNPSTLIEYSLPEEGFVSLKVYNLLGEEVITLVNENKKAGIYTVKFDGIGLTSGVYFYRITSGDYTLTKKMMLTK